MLQELQSDWAQRTRRAAVNGTRHRPDETPPPFMKEWQSLVMKLVLLHAANEGLDAVAWTRGAHQAFRYKDISHANLNELYDRTLPREVNRLLKPYGTSCETLGVYVPINFAITQTEHGYEVFSNEDISCSCRYIVEWLCGMGITAASLMFLLSSKLRRVI